jgi:hypothetical protein
MGREDLLEVALRVTEELESVACDVAHLNGGALKELNKKVADLKS